MNRSVTAYVAYDQRFRPLPNWLADWTATGLALGTTDVSHNLYAKHFDAGTINLGGNSAAGGSGHRNNYSVVIVPR